MDTDFNNGVWDCAWRTSCGAPPREIRAEELEQGVYGGGRSTQPDPHLACLRLGKQHYGVGKRSGKGGGMARCQVEGCNAVLVSAKEYHKRHKVCEVHAKAPIVVVLGLHQRFCQQCSRFHPVSEFDEWKRSCRRRLAGHNQRRRKTSASYSHLPLLVNSSTLQDEKKVGEGEKGGHSLLSPAADDLSWRSSAALQELIAENRASLLLPARRHRCHWDTTSFHQGSDHVTLDLMDVPSSALGEARVQGQYFDQPQVLQLCNLLQANNTNNHINHLF